jgi:sugar lactone lactonase YvrE
VVSDPAMNALVRVDRFTGDRTILSDNVTGDGPRFESVMGLAIESSGALLVLDTNLPRILRVNPFSGDRSIVSDAETGTGPPLPFGEPGALDVESDGSIVTVTRNRRVYRVDPVSGDRTIVSDDNVGSGPPFLGMGFPWSIAIGPDGVILTGWSNTGDTDNFAIIAVHPVTGDRTVISSTTIGSGPVMLSPGGMVVDPEGTIFVATGYAHTADFQKVLRVDPHTGDRTVVSDLSTGIGIQFESPAGLARTVEGELIVPDRILAALIEVNEQSGDRTLVSGGPVGSGPHFGRPGGVAVERNGSLVVTNHAVGPGTVREEVLNRSAHGRP